MFEGMCVKLAKFKSVGIAVGALKPDAIKTFLGWDCPKQRKEESIEEWLVRVTDELTATVKTTSVITMVWTKDTVFAIVRGEYFAEADVKEEFLNYVNFLNRR